MATYKSGDVVGTRNIVSALQQEVYTWRLRYIKELNIWVLTVQSNLPTAWEGRERIQSATDLNQYSLYPEFKVSDWVNVIADNATLARVGLSQSEPLSDKFVQDSTTTADPALITTIQANLTTIGNGSIPPPAATGFKLTSTHLVIAAIVIVLILILKK